MSAPDRKPEREASDDTRISDHLANERTYLAWLRTGIATMGFGVVIARLRYIFPSSALPPPSQGLIHASNIGLLFTLIGLVTVLLAAHRFVVVQQQIRTGKFRASNGAILALTGVVSVLGLLILWYLAQSGAAH